MSLPAMGCIMRCEWMLFKFFLNTHVSVDAGSPFDSFHPENHTRPRRRDSGRSLASYIFRPLRSFAGLNHLPLHEPNLTAAHVRSRSHVIPRKGPCPWCQTFCNSCTRFETRSLHLRFSSFLLMIRFQMLGAH